MTDTDPMVSRTIPAPIASIVAATDLGSVAVTKRGNLYLLTDPRGDIRVDGRGLGLYHLDTRVLSTSIIRLNGVQPTLLRGPQVENGADTIQLTNREPRLNPADKRETAPSLARRELSLTRKRRIDADLRESLTIVNYSETTESLEIGLGLGVDMADIFEVRGYPRPVRGTLRRSSCTGTAPCSATTDSMACAGRPPSSPRAPDSNPRSTRTRGRERASWRPGGRASRRVVA